MAPPERATPKDTSRSPSPTLRKTQKRASNWHENYNHDRSKALYGDVVNTAVGCIVNVFYGKELLQMDADDPLRESAIKAYAASVAPLIFVLPAALTKNLWLSRLGSASVVLGLSYLSLADWPYPGECPISAMMQGQVFTTVMSNVSLSFSEKMARLAYIFAVASYVSIVSPHSDYADDTLPILGGTILLVAFGLYVYHFEVSRQLATMQGARLSLGTIALVIAWKFSGSFSVYENLSKVVVALGVGCLGVLATGTFQQELAHSEQLERLVRKRTRELEHQNKQLRMVGLALQASETAIAIADQHGTIVWVNAALEALCDGKSPTELIGLPLKDTIYDLDPTRKENRYILFNALEDLTASSRDELRIRDSVFRLEATPFAENPKASITNSVIENDRFLVVFKDVTAERARETAEKEAREKATTAKAMGDAMVTLTHELRTPLQGILGVTSLLLQQVGLSADTHESLKLIMASSGLLLNLINNLLDIKKVTAKMMRDFPMASIAASGPIRDAVGFCQPLASISSVKLVVEEPKDAQHAVVRSNAIRLQQVLINLVSNAIKYTRLGSEIRVCVETSTLGSAELTAANALASSRRAKASENEGLPVLVFSVSDCGPGIAPDQADRLFQRYGQLDARPSRTLGGKVGQPAGTGLGLNLCQEFVERMNGRIWATNNTHGDGASFSFYLPLVSMEGEINVGLPAVVAKARKRTSPCGSFDDIPLLERRVLLVDDTLINRKVFQRMLGEIGVPNLVTVESGERALEELSVNEYDVVITDLQMPGMPGTELSRLINESSSAPVVVGLTADSGGDVAGKCAESGMADVLSKPITLTELKDYFETTLPRLKPGVWYTGRYNARNENSMPSQ